MSTHNICFLCSNKIKSTFLVEKKVPYLPYLELRDQTTC